MRTAESVVLTDCPPGPDDRNTSTWRSFGSISTSTSSASGRTATVADEVWTRPCDSVTGTRWTRCGPASNFMRDHTPVAGHPEHDLGEATQLGRRGRHHLERPAPAGGERPVHLEQVAGEQVRLLASLGPADLDDDVALVIGVAWEEQDLDLLVQLGRPVLQRVDLVAHLVAVGPRQLAEHLPGRGEVVGDPSQLVGAVDQRFELLAALRQLHVAGLVGEHLRVGEQVVDLS